MTNTAGFLRSLYSIVKAFPPITAFTKTTAWKRFRHTMTLRTSPRQNCHFTSFLRMPTQFEALSGPVLDFLLEESDLTTVKLTIMGCSTGAEAFTIASVLRSRHPELPFSVAAYDIDEGCIEKARTARYTPEELFNNEVIESDLSDGTFSNFVDSTFCEDGGQYVVKRDIRRHVHFDVVDALDPHLSERIGMSDIVYAQHFLIHLTHKMAKRGLTNILRLLKPRSALFVSGTELDMLVSLTRKNDLTPCEYKIEQIYKEAELYGRGWPYAYTGFEPFMTVKEDWRRRYATIFLSSGEAPR